MKCTSDGAECIELYGKNTDTFVIIFMDVTVPGMSGLETFDQSQRVVPDINVVLSSGFEWITPTPHGKQ